MLNSQLHIIDFKKKGNVIRLYLGDTTDCWGDDWDDIPYDLNAGEVYDDFVKGYTDISVPFDDLVLEPCDGMDESYWSKKDMQERKVPCILIVPKKLADANGSLDFRYWLGCDGVEKIYFGDVKRGSHTVYFNEE